MSNEFTIAKPSTCTLRPPRPDDFGRMADLAGQLGYRCSPEQVETRFLEMQDGDHAVYVAELPGGQIAGWIAVYIFRSIELEAHAEINGLIVGENHRGVGIGKLLLDAAEEWARSRGCRILSVPSNVIRERAHGFYTSNGFEHVKTQKVFWKRIGSTT